VRAEPEGTELLSGFEGLGDSIQRNLDTVELTLRNAPEGPGTLARVVLPQGGGR